MRLEFFKKLGIDDLESEILSEFKESKINSKAQVKLKIKELSEKYGLTEDHVRNIISSNLLLKNKASKGV